MPKDYFKKRENHPCQLLTETILIADEISKLLKSCISTGVFDHGLVIKTMARVADKADLLKIKSLKTRRSSIEHSPLRPHK